MARLRHSRLGRTRNYRAHFRRTANVSPQRFPAPGIRSSALALGKGPIAPCGSCGRQSASACASGVRPQLLATQLVRDYAAYCGTSDDGQKAFAIIEQLGKRKPLLRKALAESSRERCPAPVWQRNPVRVTFATKEDPKLTVAVKSRSVEVASEDDSEGEE